MKIIIRNNSQLPNKNLRFIKWKLFNLKEKFDQLHYVELHLNVEGQSPKTFIINARLGIPGNDIIMNNKSEDLREVFAKTLKGMNRYMSEYKSKKVQSKF